MPWRHFPYTEAFAFLVIIIGQAVTRVTTEFTQKEKTKKRKKLPQSHQHAYLSRTIVEMCRQILDIVVAGPPKFDDNRKGKQELLITNSLAEDTSSHSSST